MSSATGYLYMKIDYNLNTLSISEEKTQIFYVIFSLKNITLNKQTNDKAIFYWFSESLLRLFLSF
ncbi:hypothetical protein [Vibrio neptunius]|uniref:Uncharacterized protein n=1 Tax=Vibrio neptunius TaxID=170651 RepID=A0ABS3A4A9_9VIBR|nr:hypothetical protein [Vibrio neptunius]MBN3494189.1 hypothetical protein [Vibrio neptunius]MBN3516593.1 hypothetical protein [Vibrio neptunius]MBN3550920.1 hypothetical protein [Vibrio neptunius]MBN3579049.1 hypothetical protein [Vibrio neptunius]MCH9872713.1 hypothetical protein [Vibrio neptunius]